MPKRCALGCQYIPGITYHQFPHPVRNSDRFKVWVHMVGGKLECDADYEYYKNKVICDIHFTEQFKNRNNRLNALAVPSLYLQGLLDPTTTDSDVPFGPSITCTQSCTLQQIGAGTLLSSSAFHVSTAGTRALSHGKCTDRSDNKIRSDKSHKNRVMKMKKMEQRRSCHRCSLLLTKLQQAREQIKKMQSEIIQLRKRSQTL